MLDIGVEDQIRPNKTQALTVGNLPGIIIHMIMEPGQGGGRMHDAGDVDRGENDGVKYDGVKYDMSV